ncbi:hypothetical protein BGZ61DRAFT_533913 [Ilyonectria robusta]|uniref:uncharacterized protein n=1 Tax=Ilyonectria robusta TaxID=1079257 RepID=UPI001E8DD5F3|nr:uncharacterized protein BGZ61DRAFT_533913 [Ilyonectria robusta]KAH8686371.1 hypothetical protein BGZ61DRAFT_533913 [Ilyonectria robusta]
MTLPSHVNLIIATATICTILIITRCSYRLFFPCKQHPECHRRWRVDDSYMAFALLPLIVRTVLMTWSFSLDPETSHDPATLREAHALGKTVDEIDADRKLALILLMPVRITYALFLWSLKLCLLSFYSRFVSHLKWGKVATITLWWTIMFTFVGVLITTLAECRPLHLNWDIVPENERDSCSQGVANLLVMAVSNAVTDIALLILPFPMLYNTQLDRKHKGQLSVLFGIGIIVVAITIVRIPLIFMSSVTQSSRSLWASIEILCACVVANAAFFYAIVKDLQSRSHSHGSSNNMPSNDFYLQSLQSTSRAPNERKRGEVVEQIDLEESRPPTGNGSDHSLWTGLHSGNNKS